ncbi:fused FliR family export protein/FlhB family type III secretion system protein [Clostridium tagluense]|uniref:fused FliR family export protein/FlhB family type III secretion system protein n=1 Tax=Clostridium tagluense TaxID=360422 RepID=UPI001C0D4266|nr:fused FliR family export protein/FlhB family type III secretion system protein [Clostridium tagluense]MBU3126632.1 fused FliR family export protein/FlhB family type III secretion system protein [Clostridium tagluense]MCB2310000.1 fused FliR family export protein/FlhB family type III secretion system protein [Clostridium tagluense]MCB2314470.1 fused FliR family export protein/FlhB family type III secretion system protein [Clostridium tagluense]MCB2319318.1 fused FliR family export protein/Flh
MINTAYYLGFIMVLLRVSAFVMGIPIFFPKGTPAMVKVGFCVVFTFLILPGVNYANVSLITSNTGLIIFCIDEVITGLALGYITKFCFFSAQMAGQLMDFQVGFSMMSMFDPISNQNVTLLGNLLYWVSMVMFFVVDGHHMLIRAIIDSFNVVNIGKFILSQGTVMMMVKIFIEFFTLGFKIAIPIILIIIITDLSMGLVSRTVPQLNVMILGMPIKILVGLSCFALALPIIIKLIVNSFYTIPDIIKAFYKVIPMLILVSSDSGEKTEEATPKKKSDSKKKGQVAKSKELSSTITLLTSTLLLIMLGAYILDTLKGVMIIFLENYLTLIVTEETFRTVLFVSIIKFGLLLLPIMVPIMIMGVVASLMQSGFILTGEPLKPDLKKLSPISGFKKIFSTRSLVDLLKNLAIVTTIGIVAYNFIKDNYLQMMNYGSLKIEAILVVFGKLVIDIFFKIAIIMLIISVIDFAYQKYKHNKELKMSMQEVKEEYKQQEGDPQIKSKIRQKQREMASSRMMQSVPDATVVVTNPTHLAIAIKYEQGGEGAPIVVAIGADNVAIKIKEIASVNDIPIIENKPLARLIYKELDIGSEIPTEMYGAVAEILALVYKLKKRK